MHPQLYRGSSDNARARLRMLRQASSPARILPRDFLRLLVLLVTFSNCLSLFSRFFSLSLRLNFGGSHAGHDHSHNHGGG